MEEQLEMIAKGRQFKHLMERRNLQLCKELGLKRMELEVLYFLSVSEEHNTSADICHYLKVNKGHISQTVDNLCRLHYLEAVTDCRDRRYVHYYLTENARDVVERIQNNCRELDCQIFAGLTENEKAIYREISLKIKKNMEKMMGEQK